jgi:hypothetical protein
MRRDAATGRPDDLPPESGEVAPPQFSEGWRPGTVKLSYVGRLAGAEVEGVGQGEREWPWPELDAPVYRLAAGLDASEVVVVSRDTFDALVGCAAAAEQMVVEQQQHSAPGWSMAKSWAWDKLRDALGSLRAASDPPARQPQD